MASNSHGQTSTEDTSKPNDQKKFEGTKDDDYGFYFYPERGVPEEKPSFWKGIWQGRTSGQKLKCETNVAWCIENHPMVKLMMRALKSHGCAVDLTRHVSCEKCRERVNGGFDPTTNQVVVCQNNATKRSICCNVLAHEFIHAFDACRAKVDFENLRHLACSEIRAANIMHCSFMAAVSSGDASPVNIKQRHQECVKSKAIMSVLMVRNVTHEKASQVVDSVFDKCYKDLEPVGRRPRKGSRDPDRALIEGAYYGYTG
ncbi:mitochondrial inner membrane protease ATP23 homolog [Haliotis rufescens]|uniref:mitochondrial inner membrane protease ATP23 homolog n=1 Tax=Haliotis rufescens TaxID=6454 RepID=UPI001EB03043|nr:mitochondrial inner membrane protease ATP23 homolog [Haliotis rufescens]XP_046372906.1 mitochondrial inner membrane protease ATP23 homolog [Haliotis rufescens]